MLSQPRFQKLREAWEQYVETGTLSRRHVRPIIGRSWERCRSLAVDPWAPKTPLRVTGEKLEALRATNDAYLTAALPFMRFLETAVRGTGFILVLTNRDGIVLEAFGDAETTKMAERNNYVAGCCRTEAEVGTNSIGIALAEGKAIQVTGPEHYKERHHRWTCTSSPVVDPSGGLLGTVTLSGHSLGGHPHTLGMVVAAAQGIEDRLGHRAAQHAKGKLNALLESTLQHVNDALVTIDTTGEITHVNAPAAQMLSRPKARIIGLNIGSVFSDGIDVASVLASGDTGKHFEVAYDGGRGQSYFVVKPYLVHAEGRVESAILALRDSRTFAMSVPGTPELQARHRFRDIVGDDPRFLDQIALARTAAAVDSRVLITGETGTGKELIAQAIHTESSRADGPFVAINCAAIPRDLIESELMGYRGGAFTGARRGGQIGKLELADGGTLFLDEISQMPMEMQAKLLRVLEDGVVTRLGDTRPLHVNVRIITATNENLFEKCRLDGFRHDLYFRLSVVEITVPPLRERLSDLPTLIQHFLERLGQRFGKAQLRISDAAIARLMRYSWPGNVRELENVLEMSALLVHGDIIDEPNLPARVSGNERDRIPSAISRPLREVEAELLHSALVELNGNIALVARRLGVSRSTIYRRMSNLSITRSFSVR